jgi:hypothetical protein
MNMMRRVILTWPLLAAALLLTAGCGGGFGTAYDAPVPAGTAQGWRLEDVTVNVPETLTVSEAKAILPRADIVWREDEGTDRRAQVRAILGDAVRAGTADLTGSQGVTIALTVSRFHALTFEAETRLRNAGVHDIEFTATITDAATGAVLKGPDAIEASLPALAGVQMATARARGETQKSQITAHVARVIAGWLGTGPDPRGKFSRLGG